MSRTRRRSGRVSRINPRVPQSGPSEFLNSRAFADFRALSGDISDNIPGVRGIGAKTAAALLAGGLTLDNLAASSRLQGRKGAAITSAWPQLLTWRSMIRMDTSMPVPRYAITGTATTPLPAPAKVIDQLGLWRRSVPAAEGSSVPA